MVREEGRPEAVAAPAQGTAHFMGAPAARRRGGHARPADDYTGWRRVGLAKSASCQEHVGF
ncbi:hypothetical protein, partial [Pseudacidovorax intermedius]|uniref:hypothetical protein n=1 Tax=Pseudacidovorax intermedius TaxID=433924 RepID=UPI001E58B6A5